MKISVITVVRNRVKTIENAINSLKSQTYKNIEYIVIDGASTDGTFELINSTLDSSDIFISEPDLGIYDALNKGLKVASGEIIVFLHSDDIFYDHNVIGNICKRFLEGNYDIIYGDVSFFSPLDFNKIIRKYSSKTLSINNLRWGWMPAHPAMFIRRSIYEHYGYFNINYKIAGDYEFLCRISKSGEIRALKVDEVFIKMSSGGISTSSLRSKIILNLEVLKACRDNGLKTNLLMILLKYPLKFFEFF